LRPGPFADNRSPVRSARRPAIDSTIDPTILSGRQALSAAGAARIDDRASGARGHACAKTMSTGALEFAWLESTFHGPNTSGKNFYAGATT